MKLQSLTSWHLVFVFSIVGLGSSAKLVTGQTNQPHRQKPKIEEIGKQMADKQSEDMRPKTKVPLGTKRSLDELKAVLDASEPTNSPSIRRVVISVPNELPEYFRLREAGTTAVREFFLIADTNSLNLENFDPTSAPNLEGSEGQKAMLSNGGTIRLRIRKIKENKNLRSVGELHIRDHGIPGYEKVNQVEFISQ